MVFGPYRLVDYPAIPRSCGPSGRERNIFVAVQVLR
jgi:hypothetical protein